MGKKVTDSINETKSVVAKGVADNKGKKINLHKAIKMDLTKKTPGTTDANPRGGKKGK